MSAPATFTVIGHNVQGTDPQRQITATVGADLNAGASVLLLSELHPDVPVPQREGWGIVRGGGELGIMWDHDVWSLASHGYIPVHGGQRGVTPNRGVLRALLRHNETGRLVCFMAGHAVHHVEAGGLPLRYRGRERVKYAFQQRRLSLYTAKLAWSIGRWRAGGVDVVWHADLNVDYGAEVRLAATRRCRYFPLTALGKVSHVVMPKTATEGRRRIDWTGIAGRLGSVSSVTLSGTYSDHRAVKSVLAFTESPVG